ncbi:hypothetical protein [Streptomyces rhizosphaerihabitans]|uniref:hypothetical protein n=1 Tax=Streptomyces rhizosphaerihabitans TaxID=1266770 RepID=UPI0021C16988|nr:hypothetical protein [Streptomyces rhizosphaerihabitans]MCT9011714.1 hypothetical protein [Streptomyces rhizosphaerihabitans]
MAATACAGPPADSELRAKALGADAQRKRHAQEVYIRGLLASFSHVEGLHPGHTVFEDRCGTSGGNLLEPATGPLLTCSMSGRAVFGVEGEVTDVLRHIDAAHIVQWQPNVNGPGSASGGSMDYALMYQRMRGVEPDGRLMSTPSLESLNEDVTVAWDTAPPGTTPPAHQVEGEETPVCPPETTVYSRCDITPRHPEAVPSVRARYGTVLQVDIRPALSNGTYFEVPRSRS